MNKEEIDLQKGRELIENLTETYINTKIMDNHDVKTLLRDKIIDTVYTTVKEIEKSKIVKEAQDKIDIEAENRKRKEIKVLIIETLIIGFIIGLLVNQFTDVISFTKGAEINIYASLAWIIILLAFSFVFAFLMYTNRIDDFVSKIENKDKLAS
ncbi:hypothetical protein [Romboutsia hominis]|uniref:hypothetical protein n=1 Tax=Romboutsia hominis TaxID=1507512 RepID=UPI000B82F158|nr:hypothetical protein [Romboutsia hominis]